MRTIQKEFAAEIEVKRSRFLAYLVPYTAFENLHERLRRAHPKANHLAYAYRHINKYDQIVEAGHDDGEPKGCAGAPILNVMRGAELVESALVVVRYFGGIKLGTGGMVRAYGAAAKAVCESAELLAYEKRVERSVWSSYSMQRQIHYLADHYGVKVVKMDFLESGVEWKLVASKREMEAFVQELGVRFEVQADVRIYE